ncbi:MAG: MBL fold metallo-hydrolase [Cytophagales bacterium]
MLTLIFLILLIVVIAFFYMKKDTFGKLPSGDRLKVIENSPNYKNGSFQNLSPTPDLAEGHNYASVTYEFLFKGSNRKKPKQKVPSIKTDLKRLPLESNALIWFGHSSYFMQVDGIKYLVDPVFSGNASPIPGTTSSFDGTDIYTVDDLPQIDYLIISHDHYDHVDYKTLKDLKDKADNVICGLGVGEHLEHWGFDNKKIIEKDWYEHIKLNDSTEIYTTPARHFSGRGFSRNKSLWMSYVLNTPSLKIYIGGDSGYDNHYKEIGEKFGPIDVAIIENGQYDSAWKYIHNLPHEVLMATEDLKSKRLFPVHSSKFVLANHSWDEPLVKVSEYNKDYCFQLITPIIGEMVDLNDSSQTFRQWWTEIE